MNYFELFGIPVQMKPDTALLAKKFYALSREFHPDYVANEKAEVKTEALEKSSLLNKAWKTFQQPEETIKYVLQLKGLLEEEEKYELPPEFLMEVLEINEQLMDAAEPEVKTQVAETINHLETDMYEAVKETIENDDAGAASQQALLQVKEYYYKKKYLDRIRRQLAGMA